MIDALLLTVVGIIVGIFGTVVGVGGGFIVVPFLSLVYNLSPQLAVGTSMCIVAFNSISGAVSYARQGRVDYRTGIIFSIAMFPGAFLGAYILQSISRQSFDIGFAIMLLVIAAYSLVKETGRSKKALVKPVEFVRPQFNMLLGMTISFGVGFYASIAGVGGGLIHVPAMIYLFHYHVYYAIPTSIFILSISSTFAVASHAMVGAIAWTFVPFLGFGAILGAQIGGKYSTKIKSEWLIRALVIMIVIGAVRLIAKYI
ncbi:MAG: sulfite exporter TauE/SafE family protein [Bacteriovoracaceae bacterium]|nr:sulfite exporter TauE/SafE family protein [Bacteroidota bacterium]